jgi:hypothetical protein
MLTVGAEDVDIVGGVYSTLPSLVPLQSSSLSLVKADGGSINNAIRIYGKAAPRVGSALVMTIQISKVTEDMAG